MTSLPVLLELQQVHDNLRTIQRDLAAFPPDLARFDAERKTLAKRLEQLDKELADGKVRRAGLETALAQAKKVEERARAAVKQTQQKVHYAAAIRDLDERERERAAAARPLKDLDTRLEALEQERTGVEARRSEAEAQFQALHDVFLSEHGNQVSVRERLLQRQTELEAQLPAAELARFNRLLEARQGRALVPVENGLCSGCRTKLRIPLLAQVRDHGLGACESCQRLIHLPPRP